MSLSVAAPIQTQTMANGLALATETMPGCQSVAITCMLPLGLSREPSARPGIAAIAEEWLFKGAGDLDNQAFNHALDRLGVHRHTQLESRHLVLSAVCLAEQLPKTLALLSDLIQRPQLSEATLPPVRALCLQSLSSLEDEPEERIGLLLRKHFHPAPHNKSPYGSLDGLTQASVADIQAFVRDNARPQGTFLAIAGGIDHAAAQDAVQQTLGNWQGSPTPEADEQPALGGHVHDTDDSQQTHICVAIPGPPETASQTLALKVGLTCLSGGASGRLFTEVREKRGLCYAVSAGYAGNQDRGGIYLYAGTTPERAQETLDVMYAETQKIEQGVTQDEFDRATTTLLSRLVMQGESTESRAAALARDLSVFGRPRGLDERAQAVRALTLADVQQALAGLTQPTATLATLGPAALQFNG